MKVSTTDKLFIVEFGKPSSEAFRSYGDPDPAYVIAKCYADAELKGREYLECLEKKKAEQPLDSDGSLTNPGKDHLVIRAVKLICYQFIY